MRWFILVLLICFGCASPQQQSAAAKFSEGDRVQHILTKQEGLVLRVYWMRGAWNYDVRFLKSVVGNSKEMSAELYNESDVKEFELEKVDK